MNFNVIICTYNRREAVKRLLASINKQNLYPGEILVIDSSTTRETEDLFYNNQYSNLKYYKVGKDNRGLTKQRNYGIGKTGKDIDIVCFLDDDTVLEVDYFENLISTYSNYPDAIAVGGRIIDETVWKKVSEDYKPFYNEYKFDGFIRKLGSRNLLRKRLGLLSNQPPGIMPKFSNGFSIGFLPPSGKVYRVEYFMGGVASYRKDLFQKEGFSSFFEGYGLYEDMDFCLRAARIGRLYVNTAAQLHHLHEEAGRPNKIDYGKMVIQNGWYVWHVKYPNPTFKSRVKWNAIALLLTLIRMGNSVTTEKKREAFRESLGRIVGWWSLIFNKPEHEVRRKSSH